MGVDGVWFPSFFENLLLCSWGRKKVNLFCNDKRVTMITEYIFWVNSLVDLMVIVLVLMETITCLLVCDEFDCWDVIWQMGTNRTPLNHIGIMPETTKLTF